ncbi:MAG: hypothetical protein Kow0059_16300 [Candidatus Sumerlaeia bacterium]
MPARHEPPPDVYDIYPAHEIGRGLIGLGWDDLAARLAGCATVVLDGYIGIDWKDVRARLDAALRRGGVAPHWTCVAQAFRPEAEIERLTRPFLGGDDPLFGTRFTGALVDFFDSIRLAALRPDPHAAMNIVYGCGAALAGWTGFLVYVDLPKNEVQYRSRAGGVVNLGLRAPLAPKPQYKRFYFVDWPALNAHKAVLLPRLDLIVDGQRPDEPAFADGAVLRRALGRLSRTSFRVRPWFEPGPWGGRWILDHIPGLAADVPNYAWSFELIAPENGLILSSGGRLLEVSFDWLMYQESADVLGDHAGRFGVEFPIRFDFLDTVGGGNLSVQCHPRPDYIKRHFGENFTQDETYYILDCEPGAQVYLGFRAGVDAGEFRRELERSVREKSPADIDRFVNRVASRRHDLLLIPNGTIHGSGAGNLVLEISATPYIFTFKMYDWMRLDLDGQPRSLNIERAFDNLYFERQGRVVQNELISRPRVLSEGAGRRLVHLPTHREHFYDVLRAEFRTSMGLCTGGSPLVMNLVEGASVVLETAGGERRCYHYAETFAVPAAAERVRLISPAGEAVKVVIAGLKSQG